MVLSKLKNVVFIRETLWSNCDCHIYFNLQNDYVFHSGVNFRSSNSTQWNFQIPNVPLVICMLDRVVKTHYHVVTVFLRNLERILEHLTVNMERPCTATRLLSWVLCILDSCSRSAVSQSKIQHTDEINMTAGLLSWQTLRCYVFFS